MTIAVDRSARYLLLSNAATIAVALFEEWSAPEVMWISWCQSIVTGHPGACLAAGV